MSAILITNILIKNPKDYFTEEIQMRLDIEILQSLSREFEFQVVYIGSPDSSEKDQVLELIKIQPLPIGSFQLLTIRGPWIRPENQSSKSFQNPRARFTGTNSTYDFLPLSRSGVLQVFLFCV